MLLLGNRMTGFGAARSGIGPLAVRGADFDGTNDYMARGANLTGAADGKKGTISVWFRVDGTPAADFVSPLLSWGSSNPEFGIDTGAYKLKARFQNSAASDVLDMVGTTVMSGASGTWRHALLSWDMATAGARHMYLNDADDLASVPTFLNDTIDYTRGNLLIGYSGGFWDDRWNGCLAEVFFHTDYLDITVEANRRKFISAAGKPVDLGATGANPFGVQPILYQSIRAGGVATDFATNRGSGGNFSITGSLDLSSTNPSD